MAVCKAGVANTKDYFGVSYSSREWERVKKKNTAR